MTDGQMSRAERLLRLRKRLFDIAIAVPLLLIALPFLIACSVVLAVQLRGVPFFSHARPGEQGRSVQVLKLRTLHANTPKYASKQLTELEPVSRFAQFLRHRHLDELPQLLAVILGRMSMVGPRPRLPDFVEPIADHEYERLRESVPQACTGLWQISKDSGSTSTSHPAYDLFYVRYASVRLDAWVLLQTVKQLFIPGGVELDDVPGWVLGSGFAVDSLAWTGIERTVFSPDVEMAFEAAD